MDTPLHAAVQDGKFDVLQWLLSNGCDANIQKGDGTTPLHICVSQSSIENLQTTMKLIELLVHRGATFDMKDNNGKTPLDIALEQPDPYDLIEYMLSLGIFDLPSTAHHLGASVSGRPVPWVNTIYLMPAVLMLLMHGASLPTTPADTPKKQKQLKFFQGMPRGAASDSVADLLYPENHDHGTEYATLESRDFTLGPIQELVTAVRIYLYLTDDDRMVRYLLTH